MWDNLLIKMSILYKYFSQIKLIYAIYTYIFIAPVAHSSSRIPYFFGFLQKPRMRKDAER